MRPPDYLPLSMLNQLEYCPRRFWLMFVEGEMEINAPVLEGTQQHERAHGGGATTEGEAVVQRRISVGSERLRLAGVADVVELRPHPPAPAPDDPSTSPLSAQEAQREKGSAALVPVEYKHGRMGKWLNDHVQLCAQAMCLEDRLGQAIPYGEIFYWGSRRRVRVEFTPELRARTEAAIARAFELMEQGEIPPPLPKDQRLKCRDCSLEPVCLPEETILLSRAARPLSG